MPTLPLILSLAVAAPPPAAPLHDYAAVALSASGAGVAAVEPVGDRSAIVLRSAADGHVTRIIDPCRRCSYSGLTFGADGALAFLATDAAAGTVTLNVAEQRAVRIVATIAGIAQTPRFSPDGRRIALLVTIGAAKASGAAQAGVRQVGAIGVRSDEQRLAVFDRAATVSAADVVPLSPADRYVYEYDWTPDGRTLVATTALGDGDDNWWVATLDAIDAQTGAVRRIAKPTTQLNFPRVSPDGRTVAYIGGLMSDFGSIGGDVWTVPLAGGTPVNITPGYRATVTSIAWTGSGLLGTALAGADMAIVRIASERVVWRRSATLSAGDGKAAFSADGRTMAAAVEDFTTAPSIWAGPIGGPRSITHDNDGQVAGVTARSITWRNGGFTLQGWLLAPAGIDPAVRRPMVTVVHGGPAAASIPAFAGGGDASIPLQAGYYVFLPNPRGSYGEGETFTAANRRDFGGGDFDDIMAGIDAAEKVAPIDDNRLGLTGGSYGGFMAMWANTRTDRFKAIVAGAGLSNWVSYYGTNGIDQWMLPYFGKTLYQDIAAYEAPSAIYRIIGAHTPTFLYVGERDIEVPPTQSVEYWHALHDLGVPTSLVIYPDEGHGIRQPANAEDLRRRTIAWFRQYLGG